MNRITAPFLKKAKIKTYRKKKNLFEGNNKKLNCGTISDIYFKWFSADFAKLIIFHMVPFVNIQFDILGEISE